MARLRTKKTKPFGEDRFLQPQTKNESFFPSSSIRRKLVPENRRLPKVDRQAQYQKLKDNRSGFSKMAISRPDKTETSPVSRKIQLAPQKQRNNRPTNIIQRKVNASTLKGLIAEQKETQTKAKNKQSLGNKSYTTVGFEHEFAQMTDGPLRGLTHVEIGESAERMPWTGIKFMLETDASNALECVSPPFFVETMPNTKIPIPEDLEKINRIMGTHLHGITHSSSNLGQLVDSFNSSSGINLKLRKLPNIRSENTSPENQNSKWRINLIGRALIGNKLRNISIEPSAKNNGMSAQANIALRGEDIKDISEKTTQPGQEQFDTIKVFGRLQREIANKLIAKSRQYYQKYLKHRREHNKPQEQDWVYSSNMTFFLNQLARNFASLVSVPAQQKQKYAKSKTKNIFKKRWWKGFGKTDEYGNEDLYRQKFKEARGLSSYVKDVQDFWVKDTIMNLGLGLLDSNGWFFVKCLLQNQNLKQAIASSAFDETVSQIMVPAYAKTFRVKTKKKWLGRGETQFYKAHGTSKKIKKAMNQIVKTIESKKLYRSNRDKSNLFLGPENRLDFLSHKNEYIGVRQDTLIPGRNVKLPKQRRNNRFHVLETRRDFEGFVGKLKQLGSYNPQNPEQTLLDNLPRVQQAFPVGSFVRFKVDPEDYLDPSNGHAETNTKIDCVAKVIDNNRFKPDSDDENSREQQVKREGKYQLELEGVMLVKNATMTSIDLYHTGPYIPSYTTDRLKTKYIGKRRIVNASDVIA